MPMLTIEKLNSVVEEFDINSDGYSICIETGTYMGDTVKNMQPYFGEFHTIEISPVLHQKFITDYPNYSNVIAHLGDSSDVIPNLLEKFDENQKCVFWLDGHYAHGCTSKGDKDVPLIEECRAIDSIYKSDEGLILIDDLRLFGTTDYEDWQDITVENILSCFDNFEVKTYKHPDDMLCLYIKRK